MRSPSPQLQFTGDPVFLASATCPCGISIETLRRMMTRQAALLVQLKEQRKPLQIATQEAIDIQRHLNGDCLNPKKGRK